MKGAMGRKRPFHAVLVRHIGLHCPSPDQERPSAGFAQLQPTAGKPGELPHGRGDPPWEGGLPPRTLGQRGTALVRVC